MLLLDSCRVSCENKFVKLLHIVGFIIKKFVTMDGHMNVKRICLSRYFMLCMSISCKSGLKDGLSMEFTARNYKCQNSPLTFCQKPSALVHLLLRKCKH